LNSEWRGTQVEERSCKGPLERKKKKRWRRHPRTCNFIESAPALVCNRSSAFSDKNAKETFEAVFFNRQKKFCDESRQEVKKLFNFEPSLAQRRIQVTKVM
jgi:hypothetical protein